ncbi:MAG TPA: type II secretion system protein [Gemmataceae bacterium]|nr:type II secretion system protein [Gemmataceae bacterium]
MTLHNTSRGSQAGAALRAAAKQYETRRGLTLIELLVVLVILAILTTLAVQSTSVVMDQGRFDATQQSLQNIQNGIMGPANQRGADGSLLITGFAADMGRLPQPVDATSDPLRELWDAAVIPAISAYGLQTVDLGLKDATNNPILGQLRCGWRGPYVQPPLTRQVTSGGQTQAQIMLLDGWGNPFDALTQSPVAPFTLTLAGVGQPINVIRSRGADNQIDPSPLQVPFSAYNQDQYSPTQNYQSGGNILSLPTPLASYANSASVQVSMQAFNTSGSTTTLGDPTASGNNTAVVIVYLTPVNGVLTVVRSPVTTLQSTPTPVSFTFPNVTVGARAIQAFQYDPSNMKVLKRSPIVYLTVPSGGAPAQTLILQ